MNSYTPGPWKSYYDGQRVRPESAPDNGSQDVCHVYGETSATLANSKLIAAAPELLAACKAMAFTGCSYYDASGMDVTQSIRTLARAAIAKAEGGAA